MTLCALARRQIYESPLTLPPMRSLPSNTVTCRPFLIRSSAQRRPAIPAPTIHTLGEPPIFTPVSAAIVVRLKEESNSVEECSDCYNAFVKAAVG
jgi:hypothetical protein